MIKTFIQEIDISEKKNREFGLLMGLILTGFGGYGYFMWGGGGYFIFLVLGAIFTSLGLVTPNILRPAYISWMTLAHILGMIMTTLILSILFFMIVTPIGITMRVMGKRTLALDWRGKKQSYWYSRTIKELQKSSYEKQF